ncbi:MAG: thiamine phosphate synthase [Pirellulales bacterium]|nr:thiamine phosphate synthase [Pirellulales bacterium]
MDGKVYRLLDATANRACEATRVVEDIARFVLDDAVITAAWKQFRHDLATALQMLPTEVRSAFREVASDVGTTLSLPTETQRARISDMAAANAARLQQSLRSLEEGAKLVDEELASKIESLRYRSYEIASSMTILKNSLDRLSDVYLYVLVDGGESRDDFVRSVDMLLAAKVDAIQLRDKSLEDAELLLRARLLTEKSRQSKVLTIINDRPDIAVLSQADGVHVGQEDLSVGEARQIVGAERLIGISTHSVVQLQQAVIDGANYAGIGPVFPSRTKSFPQHGGLALLQQVAAETAMPLFAIGGIDLTNASDVVRRGIRRLAVASAITGSPDPEKAIKGFRAALAAHDESNSGRQSMPVS